MTLFKQISKNLFLYPVTGQNLTVLYDKEKRRIIISNAEDGVPVRIICTEDELTGEDFRFVATDVHQDLIDFSTGVQMDMLGIENLSNLESQYKAQQLPSFMLN